TYLGGNSDDTCARIAVDSAGNAYVTGTTQSTNFPTTPEALRPTFPGGSCPYPPCTYAYVTKLNDTGSGLVYSTFLDGGGGFSNGIDVDSTGNAYVCGDTVTDNFPTTAQAFQRLRGGYGDAFLLKINPGGTRLLYSTYFGGGDNDSGISIAVGPGDSIYLAG